MKIHVAVEIDLSTGDYDVRCDNLSQPGTPVDIRTVSQVVSRVMAQVREQPSRPSSAPQAILGLPLQPAGALLN